MNQEDWDFRSMLVCMNSFAIYRPGLHGLLSLMQDPPPHFASFSTASNQCPSSIFFPLHPSFQLTSVLADPKTDKNLELPSCILLSFHRHHLLHTNYSVQLSAVRHLSISPYFRHPYPQEVPGCDYRSTFSGERCRLPTSKSWSSASRLLRRWMRTG